MRDDVFSKIVRGELACHRVWEDEHHLAFLSIFPNTPGVTVVIPKDYQPSNFIEVDPKRFAEFMVAVQTVGKLLVRAFDDAERPAIVFEGLGVDYLHAKLFPLHGTAHPEGRREHHEPLWFDTYPGFVTSQDGTLADDASLQAIAKQIRRA